MPPRSATPQPPSSNVLGRAAARPAAAAVTAAIHPARPAAAPTVGTRECRPYGDTPTPVIQRFVGDAPPRVPPPSRSATPQPPSSNVL
ncbi:MAG: hypothetical protein FWE59_04185 [Oscillospiraceae bacterium]|nr:hypothetical protein [Oscillospiraceae bacterium]